MLSFFSFARSRSGSLPGFFRLFYLTAIKPGLVYRGLARLHPKRVYCLPLRPGNGQIWSVYIRDNAQDPAMVAEFFKGQHLFEAENLPQTPQVIYDLGANIGIASLFLGSVQPQARIFGFEPVPDHYELCRQNYLNLSNAQAFNCAVGLSSGRRTFELSQDDIRGGHLTGGKSKATNTGMKTFEVEVWSLNDLITKKNLPSPDFLKVDVEGAEMEVLEGLGAACETIRYLHLETHSVALRDQCVRWLELNHFEIAGHSRYTEELGVLWAIRG